MHNPRRLGRAGERGLPPVGAVQLVQIPRGLKTLEFPLLGTGHFALEEDGDAIARRIRCFLNAHIP